MRATELGDLLKETPLLESKLRHPTGCSESETSSATSSASNKKRKDKKSRGTRTQNSSRVKRKLEVESSGISSEPEDVFEDENGSNLEFPNLSYALMLEVASSSMTRIRDSSSQEQSVRIQRILNSLEFTFSFEVNRRQLLFILCDSQFYTQSRFIQLKLLEAWIVKPWTLASF